VVVWFAILCLYWLRPFPSFLRMVYGNTAIATAALVLAFLLADVLGPRALIGAVCLLSRVRPSVTFITRRVQTFRRRRRTP
jgi:hypothetical protein